MSENYTLGARIIAANGHAPGTTALETFRGYPDAPPSTRPRFLLEPHAAKLAVISDEVIEARGYRSELTPAVLASYGYCTERGKSPKWVQDCVPALLIPVFNAAGEEALVQIRPDNPRSNKDGKAIKYETPRGSLMCVDVHPHIREKIGDPKIALWITEGVIKADAAVSRGLCCIALLGVWNWRGGNDGQGTTVLADWEYFAFKHKDGTPREVFIAFDSDVCQKREVKAALKRLAKFLEFRGAKVSIVLLPEAPDGLKTGLDDFFARCGTVEELAALVAKDEAAIITAPDLTPSKWLAQKFPSLAKIHGDAVLEETDKDGVVFVKDLNEDFVAATMGQDAAPEAPVIYKADESRFYKYNPDTGIYEQWREDDLKAHISQLLLTCARECASALCNTKALQFRFRDDAQLMGVLRKARGLLGVERDFFASNLTEYIACANGMLRLCDGALLPFSPGFRRRNKLSAAYDPAATCPLFLETLLRPALDEADIDLLRRYCGLALIGENIAQKIMLLVGTAGGGKGTFIRVLIGIIGLENLASLRPQLLAERFELSRLLGSTLLYGADVSETFLNVRPANILKALTGGDPMTVEFKGSNEAPRMVCKFNVIATCNSRLTVHLEGDTGAWRRRLAIIEYNKPKPQNVIANLDELILKNEASGVLNWMLEGLQKLRAADWQLQLNSAQQARVDNLLLESNSFGVFARERLAKAEGASLTLADCFEAYVDFCTSRGWAALTRNRFSHVIADEVVRQFGLTTRNDIADESSKAQRGWKNLTLCENFGQRTGNKPSEVSENIHQDTLSDTSDTFFSLGCEENSAEERRKSVILCHAAPAIEEVEI